MTKVITTANRKGGVAKTTTVMHLAAGTSALGYRAVGIDMDAQGNLGQFFGLGTAPGMCDVLLARDPRKELPNVLTSVPNYPNLRLILGNDETKGAEAALSVPGSRRGIGDALQGVINAIQFGMNGNAPFIFLDTPPGLGPLQMAALLVADYVIVPVNPNYASETGLAKIYEEIRAIQSSGSKAKLLGILPTRVKPQTVEHREVIEKLKEHFGEDLIYPSVRDTVRIEEAPGRGKPVWDYVPNPKEIGTQDYLEVLRRFAKDLGLRLPNGKGGR